MTFEDEVEEERRRMHAAPQGPHRVGPPPFWVSLVKAAMIVGGVWAFLGGIIWLVGWLQQFPEGVTFGAVVALMILSLALMLHERHWR